LQGHKSTDDELRLYLETDLEDVADPLQWWTANQNTYPQLSRMALDFLSIPSMSTSIHYRIHVTCDILGTSEATSFCPVPVANSLLSQHVPFCVWALGN
jgi:hypothetical protein